VFLGNQSNRWCRLNNGLPLGSVLAPILFNLYISEQPSSSLNLFRYADYIALTHQARKFHRWCLCPNPNPSYKPHLEKTGMKVNIVENCQELNGAYVTNSLYSACLLCGRILRIWLNSVHVDKVDVQLNNAMRLITGTVKSTPFQWRPVLSNIVPPRLIWRRSYNVN
jgi:hypothetical protein